MGTSNDKNGQRFHNSDDELKNAKSFEEAREIVKSRLKLLRVDIDFRSPIEESLVSELDKAHDDRDRKLMDIYARYCSPCKVGDYSSDPRSQRDMNDIMIDFSEGYDKFIRAMEEDLISMMTRRRNATQLMTKMLSVKYPYSKIMYLCYYKNMRDSEVRDKLYMSRSSYYRIKNMGLDMLTKLCYPVDPDSDGD